MQLQFLILLLSSSTTPLLVLSQITTAKSVFILAGQSNMVGMGGVTNGTWDGVVPPECQHNPLILRLNEELGLKWEEAREPLHKLSANDGYDIYDGIGPGMPFANSLLKRDPAIGTIGLVPCAKSGSPISWWSQDSPNYSRMLRRAQAAVNEGDSSGLPMVSRESDTKNISNVEAYPRRLVELFNNVRADLQSPSLQIIQVALASGFNDNFQERIREVQLQTELLPNVKCVDAGGLPLIEPDKLHLTTESQVKLGTLLADAFLHA